MVHFFLVENVTYKLYYSLFCVLVFTSNNCQIKIYLKQHMMTFECIPENLEIKAAHISVHAFFILNTVGACEARKLNPNHGKTSQTCGINAGQ